MMKSTILFTMALLFCLSKLNAQEDGRKATKEPITQLEVFNGVGVDYFKVEPYEASKVVVSSTLPHKSNIYDKSNLTDGKQSTAWVEGRDNDGKGDNISFFFSENTPPDIIVITPGYNKDDATWYKNNRVSKIMIRMYQSEEGADGDGLLSEIEVAMETDKNGKVTPGKQYINITDLFLQHMGYTEFEVCEITIIGVDNQDAKYDDTCISEIEFLVRTDEMVDDK